MHRDLCELSISLWEFIIIIIIIIEIHTSSRAHGYKLRE